MNVGFETAHKGGKAGTHVWLTPPWIIQALGPFDLDPCFSEPRPWPTATTHYGEDDDGLYQPWDGFVWCNPPYGDMAQLWLERMARHRNGIAMTFARTETESFRKWVWGSASAILFLYGRVQFHLPDGKPSGQNAGAPSVLVGYGAEAASRLRRIEEMGKGFVVTLEGGRA